jgi:hypothetical protein
LVVCTAFIVATASGAVHAQAPVPSKPAPWGIVDNSFLVEEAFNQERGVVQNIVSFVREGPGAWRTTFTQEWPIPNVTHQLSYTVPLARMNATTGFGDVLINYRWQMLSETSARPAFAPRLSLVLPTSDHLAGFDNGVLGWQINLPFSKQMGNVYFHWNGGFTYTPHVKADDAKDSRGVTLFSPGLAGSAIWQVSPLLNVLLELTATSDEHVGAGGERLRDNAMTISPGVRKGWNVRDQQIVVGAAVPVSVGEDGADLALLMYFSYELRFRK